MTTYYNHAFAEFYEQYFTGWVRAFSTSLIDYLDTEPPSGRTLLDLCCGTGESMLAFCQRGWNVTGLDHSRGMLDRAEKKLGEFVATGQAVLLEGEATDFTLPRSVDVCICLDGALNHLETISQLESCFRSVHGALTEGGRFIFDLFEPAHFRHWHNISVIDQQDAVIVKRGVWDDEKGYGLLRVSGVFGENLRVEQTLRSRVFTPEEVARALGAAGLVPVPCGISDTRDGLRPEASRTDGAIRIFFEARKIS